MSALKVSFKTKIDFETEKIASDKSISHRCAIFSLLSDMPSKVRNFLEAEDTLCTLSIVQHLGAKVEYTDNEITIHPPFEIKEPPMVLDCGNSGTAMRLLMGFLSSLDGFFVLHGDKYLANRPMRRVASPLRQIGALIDGRCEGEYSPLSIRGGALEPFDYESKIASAQVKSALILAGLRAKGPSSFREPHLSRDHTENMLQGMGAQIKQKGTLVAITPLERPLNPLDITVPNDPSSGFFFALAAAIVPGAKVKLKNMLLNKTRIEAYKVLSRMGTKITYIKKESAYEDIGDILIEYAPMSGVCVEENIAWLIDELPALSIAFACAKGESSVRNAHELRLKESDRITSVVKNLKKCGIHVEEFQDGYTIKGGDLRSATIDSFGDHRIAMSFAVAGLVTPAPMHIEDTDCIKTSFPNFVELLSEIATVEV